MSFHSLRNRSFSVSGVRSVSGFTFSLSLVTLVTLITGSALFKICRNFRFLDVPDSVVVSCVSALFPSFVLFVACSASLVSLLIIILSSFGSLSSEDDEFVSLSLSGSSTSSSQISAIRSKAYGWLLCAWLSGDCSGCTDDCQTAPLHPSLFCFRLTLVAPSPPVFR